MNTSHIYIILLCPYTAIHRYNILKYTVDLVELQACRYIKRLECFIFTKTRKLLCFTRKHIFYLWI